MWRKAVERDRNTIHFNNIASANDSTVGGNLEEKTKDFQKLLEVPSEERDRIQRLQVVDRAAAAIAAARALLNDANSSNDSRSDTGTDTIGENGTVFLN